MCQRQIIQAIEACVLFIRENLTMKLKYTKLQLALEIIGLLFLVGMIVFIYTQWDQIPQQVPMHYNALGEIDSWGSKYQTLILPTISILLYIFMTVVSFFSTDLECSCSNNRWKQRSCVPQYKESNYIHESWDLSYVLLPELSYSNCAAFVNHFFYLFLW